MTDPDGGGRRFSILLPTYDRADVIGYAIRSALRQTYTDFEILVVCDGCSAETAAAVRSFDDERIRYFDLPKAPGFGWANRNSALREARGELIAFLGDDDLLFPDHLELFDEVFRDRPIEWAYSRPLWMSDDGVLSPMAVDLRRPSEFERFMTVGNSIPPSCVVHRRSALDRYGYWPAELWDGEASPAIDWELWRRMVGPAQGSNLDYVPIPTSVHFRARWRAADAWAIPGLRPWFERAHKAWWPTALRVPTSETATPQVAAWEMLDSDADRWLSDVRSSVVTVVDGFAWDASAAQDRAAGLEQALSEQTDRAAGLEQALSEQTDRAAGLEQALSEQLVVSRSVLDSRSWRITAPLRRAVQWLRSFQVHA